MQLKVWHLPEQREENHDLPCVKAEDKRIKRFVNTLLINSKPSICHGPALEKGRLAQPDGELVQFQVGKLMLCSLV